MDIKPYLNKAAAYCARYETCVSDLKKKLYKWKIPEQLHEQIIEYLIENGFIDQRRYARSFAHDRFYLNGWGRRKIYFQLRQKDIDEQDISQALQLIDEQKYLEKLRKIILQKKSLIKTTDQSLLRQKLINFALGRGYEPELIYKVVDELLNSEL